MPERASTHRPRPSASTSAAPASRAASSTSTTGKLIGERVRIDTPKPATPAGRGRGRGPDRRRARCPRRGPGAETPVGVTFPAIIHHGVARSAANVDKSWIGTDVDALFTDALGRPVQVMNDADAAGLAEARYGAGARCGGHGAGHHPGHGHRLGADPQRRAGSQRGAGPPGDRSARRRDPGLGLRPRTRGPGLGRIRGAPAALLLPRGVPLLPHLFVIGGGISKRAEDYLPRLSLATPITVAKSKNNAGIVGRGPAVGWPFLAGTRVNANGGPSCFPCQFGKREDPPSVVIVLAAPLTSGPSARPADAGGPRAGLSRSARSLAMAASKSSRDSKSW